MDIRDHHILKDNARQALGQARFDPQKLVLIHVAVSSGILLVQMLLSYYLDLSIGNTGGLSGMGLRSILTTVQTVLESLVSTLLPFWDIGLVALSLAISRRETIGYGTLFAGFRNFGPVLSFNLTRSLLIMGLAVACFYPTLMVYLMTPLAEPLMEILLPVVESAQAAGATQIELDQATMDAVMDSLTPMLIIFLVLFLAIYFPISYRFRMASPALLEEPRKGAFHAIRKSLRLTKGNCMSLFRLDLSFWWYYAAELVLLVIAFGGTILAFLGIPLPMSAEGAYFLFYGLSLLAKVGLYYAVKNQVAVTYAMAYQALKAQLPPPAPKQEPPQQPWTY